MYCVNTHFLKGCNFDEAYKNPCQNDDTVSNRKAKLNIQSAAAPGRQQGSDIEANDNRFNFSEEQQMKLRTIASKTGLLNFLVENSLLNNGPARSVLNSAGDYQPQEKIVFYLITAMVALTVSLIIIVIVVFVNWTRLKLASKKQQKMEQLKNHYLSNQQQHLASSRSRHYHHQRPSRSSIVAPTSNKNALDRRPGKALVKPVALMTSTGASRRYGETIDNSVL